MKAYVWPDGSVYREPQKDMSDDYFEVDLTGSWGSILELVKKHFGDTMQGLQVRERLWEDWLEAQGELRR